MKTESLSPKIRLLNKGLGVHSEYISAECIPAMQSSCVARDAVALNSAL